MAANTCWLLLLLLLHLLAAAPVI